MIEDERITLVIEGLLEDEGHVRFAAFLAELQKFSVTINRLDRGANEGKAASYFRITELSYQSPVRVVLEPQPMEKGTPTAYRIIEGLGRITAALNSDDDLSGVDADLLEDFRGLARPVGKTVKAATILFDKGQLDLTPRIAQRIDKALAAAEECDGALEGMLEQINIHSGANTFHIYPDVGPQKVTCRFPGRIYDDAVSAVGRRVEVFGTLRYRARANFPHKIAVREIEAYPPEADLPDWDDLRGRAPEVTGSLTSEEFVRRLRDGWR